MFYDFKYRHENGINVRLTSSTEIGMDTFDKQWMAYTKKSKFFAFYNPIHDLKENHGTLQLQRWLKQVLRSQFEKSADQFDRISLIHWTVEIGNREDFIVHNYIVPFHAIVKTPAKEYWYADANVNRNVLYPYIEQCRRMQICDEREVVQPQPYYHKKFDCTALKDCFELKNCSVRIEPIPQVILTECERLAKEVF